MQPSFRCVYAVVDGSAIYADVYVPTLRGELEASSANGNTKIETATTTAALPVAIGIHGGAFTLGHSGMVSHDQITDCLARSWIVLSIDHRLCPQVDICSGPVADARAALAWVRATAPDASLDAELRARGYEHVCVDREAVVAFGTSSGGTLALALGWGDGPEGAGVKAVLDLYGATAFADPFWSTPLPFVPVPEGASDEFINRVYDEVPVPTQGGVSLEGQGRGQEGAEADAAEAALKERDRIRHAFAFTHIARGTLLDVAFPSKRWEDIDATLNISPSFPPTCIVHGTEDKLVPAYLSRKLFAELRRHGVRSEFIDVPGEGHTFVGKMVKGSRTWELQRRGFDFLEEVVGARR